MIKNKLLSIVSSVFFVNGVFPFFFSSYFVRYWLRTPAAPADNYGAARDPCFDLITAFAVKNRVSRGGRQKDASAGAAAEKARQPGRHAENRVSRGGDPKPRQPGRRRKYASAGAAA